MKSASEKKWYIINQSAGRENNLFYLINATEKGIKILQGKLISQEVLLYVYSCCNI